MLTFEKRAAIKNDINERLNRITTNLKETSDIIDKTIKNNEKTLVEIDKMLKSLSK